MRKEFIISNDQGVHARPATMLVAKANEFKSQITLTYEGNSVDLKSIMGVLSLGINRGSLILVEAKGDDEAEALKAIDRLITEFNLK
ncbi:MAG: HPr family phosphocarrier protein [Candidatus Izemoplasmataceae bacterium]|jgi:phosphocarrier protein HPr|uniref:HPr family phosphocarrier protein n=1 Tax=Liberiplasma polymorphum TaxID=3374570 RepID=UPI00377646F0